MRRRETTEPETRVGNCCGCRQFPRALFKVPGSYRYRCDACFDREVGYRHHLALDIPKHCKSPSDCRGKGACVAECWKLEAVPA